MNTAQHDPYELFNFNPPHSLTLREGMVHLTADSGRCALTITYTLIPHLIDCAVVTAPIYGKLKVSSKKIYVFEDEDVINALTELCMKWIAHEEKLSKANTVPQFNEWRAAIRAKLIELINKRDHEAPMPDTYF